MADAAAAAAAAAAANAPPNPFALTPAMVGNGNNPLDWTRSENQKLYHKAVEKLSVTFEGKSDQVILLGQALQNRAIQSGWNATLMDIPDTHGTNRNLITDYGRITYEEILDWATTNVVGATTRTAQDNMMMYQCLYNSINEDVKKRIITKRDKYEINGLPIAAAFYKVLIGTAEVETKATVAYIRMNLMNLTNKISDLNFDVTEFHNHVNQLVTTLASHGKESEDLSIYLFEAYLSAPDEEFRNVLAKKKSDFHMGIEDLTHNQLMSYAQNCYDVRNADNLTPWMQKSKEKQEFEALTATVKELRENNNKLGKQIKANKTSKKTGGGPPIARNRNREDKFAWKKVAPTAGEALTKEVDGKTYHWCVKHKAWVLHKPAECRLNTPVAHDAEVEDDDEEDDETAEERALASYAAAVAMEG